MDLIKIAEEAFATKKELPSFKSGDTITVAYRIKEGNKERIQQYRGVVIRISGHGDKKRFTVRKMSENVGVERIFPIESPFIESITVNKVGKVRRAKLYYLRALTGKKARIKGAYDGHYKNLRMGIERIIYPNRATDYRPEDNLQTIRVPSVASITRSKGLRMDKR